MLIRDQTIEGCLFWGPFLKMATTKVKRHFFVFLCFFVILGPENVCLDTNIFFYANLKPKY